MTAPQSGRIGALDWVKGALVVCMVVYHSLNYSTFHPLAYRYLAFLPPSFIFIAGFLMTNNYLARYDVKAWRLHRRLISRGLKMVALFTLLNVGVIGSRALRGDGLLSAWDWFVENWQTLYFPKGGRVASFYILATIGYLLILSPLLLLLQSRKRWSVPVLAAVCLITCSWLEREGKLNYHTSMLCAGVFGVAMGTLSLEDIGRFARKWFVVVPLYCCYRVASTFLGDPFLLQLAAVCLTLLLLFGGALAWSQRGEGPVFQQIALLGRYSLLGYIFQLPVIQVLDRFLVLPSPLISVVAVMLVVSVLTWGATWTVEKLRSRSPFFDASYKAVFA